MTTTYENSSKNITTLLNGTIQSIQQTIPIPVQMGKPSADTKELHTQFGVLIGITGHVKGQLLFSGDHTAFGVIGKSMFGMELSGEMLNSFCGEFGNMIAGGLATIVSEQSVSIDITSPTLIEGDMRMTGFKRSLSIPFTIESTNELTIYFLLDK